MTAERFIAATWTAAAVRSDGYVEGSRQRHVLMERGNDGVYRALSTYAHAEMARLASAGHVTAEARRRARRKTRS